MKALHLLLVEDCASDIRLIREALKETGARVDLTVKCDGVEALEYLRQAEIGAARPPDMILLDLNLPRKNGREVLAEVKSSPALRNIPVLVMTSSQADDDVNACYALNANSYVTKPNDLDDYIEAIRSIENFWFSTARLPEPPRAFNNGHTRGGFSMAVQ